jgi:vacuolar-type H+-ATPase subunit E/Vma4
MQLNASRITVLQAQDDLVSSMREAAGKELLRISGDQAAYKKLLKELIIQVSIFFAPSSIFLFIYSFYLALEPDCVYGPAGINLVSGV